MRAAALLAALAVCAAPARSDEPTPVEVEAGGTLSLCKAGLVPCPVSTSLCDDPKVAVIRNAPDGAELKGLSAGTTLCSALGFQTAFRRVLRVTVTPPKR